jgi:Aconitase C-terminal domain
MSRPTTSSPPARVVPYWSNIPKVAAFAFEGIDGAYARRAGESRDRGEAHVIVACSNYGQGSSRENAAAAPRHLGLQLVVAESFARIHSQNLVNFGVLPLTTRARPSASTGARRCLTFTLYAYNLDTVRPVRAAHCCCAPWRADGTRCSAEARKADAPNMLRSRGKVTQVCLQISCINSGGN